MGVVRGDKSSKLCSLQSLQTAAPSGQRGKAAVGQNLFSNERSMSRDELLKDVDDDVTFAGDKFDFSAKCILYYKTIIAIYICDWRNLR